MAHVHSAARRYQRSLAATLILTTAFLAAEVVGGLLTHSLALLADAGHMLADVAGLGLALLAIRFAAREPTVTHTYGYYRVEILAAVVNAVVLFGISGYILLEAYRRFVQPLEVASGWMLVVALVGLAVNLVAIVLLRAGSSESLNLRGAYFEVLSDMLGSLGVILAAVVIRLTGWTPADALVSAAIGVFILPRTWHLLSDAISVLLEGTPRDVDTRALRESLQQLDGITNVHDLHVWTLTSGMNALSVHVVVPNGLPSDTILRRVHDCARKQFRIAHVTVQVEPTGYEEQETHL